MEATLVWEFCWYKFYLPATTTTATFTQKVSSQQKLQHTPLWLSINQQECELRSSLSITVKRYEGILASRNYTQVLALNIWRADEEHSQKKKKSQ